MIPQDWDDEFLAGHLHRIRESSRKAICNATAIEMASEVPLTDCSKASSTRVPKYQTSGWQKGRDRQIFVWRNSVQGKSSACMLCGVQTRSFGRSDCDRGRMGSCSHARNCGCSGGRPIGQVPDPIVSELSYR